MSETVKDEKTLLDEFFSLDPLSLTSEHIEAGIAKMRANRAAFMLGEKKPKAPKEPKKQLNLDDLEI